MEDTMRRHALASSLVAGLAAAILGCGVTTKGDDPPGAPGKADDLLDPEDCPAGPDVDASPAAPLDMYPLPRHLERGDLSAAVTTACVDLREVPVHDRLDELVPELVAA